MGPAPPVSIVCLAMFVRPSFDPCHGNMFAYLVSKARSSFSLLLAMS